LIKEIDIFKSQNFNLKEQNTKIENDLNQANVYSFNKIFFGIFVFYFREILNELKNNLNRMKIM
jgi:hypothetical protein